MNRGVVFSLLAVWASMGCAAKTEERPAAVRLGGAAQRTVELPGRPGPGAPKEVRVLIDSPAVKLATIVLRAGTVLPTHHAQVPVTITALEGGGVVVAGGERLRVDSTHAVALEANVAHSVEPDANSDLVLLVHHLGRGTETHGR